MEIMLPAPKLVLCPGCHSERDRREEDSCVQPAIGSFWARYECGCEVEKFNCPHCNDALTVWNDRDYANVLRSQPSECHRF